MVIGEVFVFAVVDLLLCDCTALFYFNYWGKKRLISLSDEKKKTKVIDSEVNPVWNEVTNPLSDRCMFEQADFTLIAEKLCSDNLTPRLWCVMRSCLRCWSLIWREQHWTRPPALMWLWKTTKLLAKISKCGAWVLGLRNTWWMMGCFCLSWHNCCRLPVDCVGAEPGGQGLLVPTWRTL